MGAETGRAAVMIRLGDAAWRVMLGDVLAAYPREGCGVLLGEETGGERRVEAAMAAENRRAGEAGRSFLIAETDLLRADTAARETGLRILGFYHSHPDSGVYFSEGDRENAWPGYSHVVISVRQGRFAGAGAFRVEVGETVARGETIEWT